MDGPLCKVDRRGALVGLFVEGAPLLHIVRHIRNMHSQPVVSVRQPLDRDRIIKIPGVLAIDGDRSHGSEIGAAADVFLLDSPTNASRLGDSSLRVDVRKVVLANDDLCVDAGLFELAQYFDDPADRPA